MTGQPQNIVALETRFWDLLKTRDAKGAAALVAEHGLVTGAQGVMRIDPARYEEMARDGKWTLDDYTFSDVEVVFPTDDVAVIGYKVRQTGTIGDGPMDMTCVDSSTWVRSDGAWKCAHHSEVIIDGAPGG